MRKEKFITYLMCIPEGHIRSYGFDTIEEIMEALTIWGENHIVI